MTKPLYYGWILLGVLWLVFAFNLGFPAYGGPVINSAMAKELGFSAARRWVSSPLSTSSCPACRGPWSPWP